MSTRGERGRGVNSDKTHRDVGCGGYGFMSLRTFRNQRPPGSIVTTSTGAVLEYVRYKPFGEPRGHYDAGGNLQAVNTCGDDGYCREFTGYDTEPISGLQYAGARFFDPAIGMFLTHDPARQSASPYTYVNWDPINRVDPSGTFWEWVALAFALGFTAAFLQASVNGAEIEEAAKAGAISGGIAAAAAAGLELIDMGIGGAAWGGPAAQHTFRMIVAGTGVVGGTYSAAEGFRTGQFVIGSVGALAAAFSAYAFAAQAQAAQGGNGGTAGGGASSFDLRYGIADPSASPTPRGDGRDVGCGSCGIVMLRALRYQRPSGCHLATDTE